MAGASPLVGSSTSSSRHGSTIARAMATICFWPPERFPAGMFQNLLQRRQETEDPLQSPGIHRRAPRAEKEVLAHRKTGKHRHALGNVGDAGTRDLRRIEGRDVVPVEAKRPAARPVHSHDGLQRRRLAGAVAAEKHRRRGLGDFEVDSLENVVLPDVRVHAGEREQRLRHRRALRFPGTPPGRRERPSPRPDCRRPRGARRAGPGCDRPANAPTSSLCSTSSTVLSPWSLMWWISSRMIGTSSMLMPAVGSSNIRTCGSRASRIATSSFRCSPCESEAARACRRSASATRCRKYSAFSISSTCPDQSDTRLSPRPARLCTARRTFSITVRFGKRFVELERPPDAAPRALRGAQARDVLAEQPHRSRARAQLPGHQVEIRGLPRAVRAHDRGERSGVELRRDRVHRDVARRSAR